MTKTGTHTLADLVKMKNQTVVQYGYEAVQDIVEAELEAHNAIRDQMVEDYAETTTRPTEPEGTGQMLQGTMTKVDSQARVRTQRNGMPEKVSFPVERSQFAIGFDADFLRGASVAEVATRALAVFKADATDLINQLKYALFNPVNYTFYDELNDDMPLSIKALFNGDGVVPANGPNSEIFAGTHNHYMTAAAWNETAADSLVLNVAEHNGSANVRLHINVAQESATRAFTGFYPILDARVVPSSTTAYAQGSLNTGNRGNRLIGIYNNCEVWVKPWVPSGYILAVDVGSASKVARIRIPEDANRQGLRMVAETVLFPLQSKTWEIIRGVGIKTRSAAAVLQITGGAYTSPV